MESKNNIQKKLKNMLKSGEEVDYVDLCEELRKEYSEGTIYQLTLLLLKNYNYLEIITTAVSEYETTGALISLKDCISEDDVADLLKLWSYEEAEDGKFVKEYLSSHKIEQTIYLKKKIDKAIEDVRKRGQFTKRQKIYELRYEILKKNLLTTQKKTLAEMEKDFFVTGRTVLREKQNAIMEVALYMFPPVDGITFANIDELTPELFSIYIEQ